MSPNYDYASLLNPLILVFATLVFMLQTRHHNINDHERNLQNKYKDLTDELRNIGNEKKRTDNEIKLEAQKIRDEIDIVIIRYDAALWAFILVMLQMIVGAVFIAKWVVAKLGQPDIYIWPLIVFGMTAYIIHVGFDLFLAFKTQKIHRKLLNELDKFNEKWLVKNNLICLFKRYVNWRIRI